MTTEAIMTPRPMTLRHTDKVSDALLMMHGYQVRNLPVVDENGHFVGLFGIRRLSHLLLPKAAQLDRYSLSDLSFLPDDIESLEERLAKIGDKPVSDFLEKKKKLMFCKPDTTFPELLELLDRSSDSSLPVIVVEGKKKKLVGIVSAWDVLDRLIIKIFQMRRETAEPAAAEETPKTGPSDSNPT
ncbi:MAG: CBS domain-containing protein [Gammaproteobacteria bacterium]|nr:CBS domain-containing protein [Gammaproteobacteria bacterium]MDJ0871616.1 CBS domain-containing protein [Gammaproteobacteria bacterium]MDJ0890811.1 CBS domain-containing protein [Gammaproteobacteria bacterium]